MIPFYEKESNTRMTELLQAKVPKELVDIIKLYTGEGVWNNGKYINIIRIPKDDPRYSILKSRPRIKQIKNSSTDQSKQGCVWFKLPTGKFMVITMREGRERTETGYLDGLFWELFYNKKSTILYMG